MDILTFLGIGYKDASLITCTLFSKEKYSKNQINQIIILHKNMSLKQLKIRMYKWTYGHSDNEYRVATLSKSFLTTTGITMQSLKSNMPKRKELTVTNGLQTDPI